MIPAKKELLKSMIGKEVHVSTQSYGSVAIYKSSPYHQNKAIINAVGDNIIEVTFINTGRTVYYDIDAIYEIDKM